MKPHPPGTIATDDLADLSGFTSRHLNQLAANGTLAAADGSPIRPVRNRWLTRPAIKALFAYCRSLKSDARTTLARARARKMAADAAGAERREAQAAGLLVYLAEAKSLIRSLFHPLRQRILEMPAELAAKVNPADPDTALEILTAWRDALLAQMRAVAAKVEP